MSSGYGVGHVKNCWGVVGMKIVILEVCASLRFKDCRTMGSLTDIWMTCICFDYVRLDV